MQVYSGAASETAFIGKESPGPMAYDPHPAGIGRQVSTSELHCAWRCAQMVVAHHGHHRDKIEQLSVDLP